MERGSGMIGNSGQFARRALMTTVSTAALVMVSGGQSYADHPGPTWWASIEGQYQWIHGDAIDFYSVSVDPDNGWSGKAHFGGMLDHVWSGSVGIRYGQANKETDSAYFYYPFATGASYDEDHLVIDLEIGRNVGLGGSASARIHGGARFARFDGQGQFYSGFIGTPYQAASTQRFTGFGPRIGMDAQIPISENMRADIGVAGALLYGRRKTSIAYYAEYGDSYSDSDKGWVPNVEASVALTYLLAPNAALSAGYRAEKWWNIMPTVDSSVFDEFDDDDRLMHGPFLRLTITGN